MRASIRLGYGPHREATEGLIAFFVSAGNGSAGHRKGFSMTTGQQALKAVLTSFFLCATSTVATASSLDQVLEGADGDRVTILLAKDKREAAEAVMLCLFDGTIGETAKAFDIRIADMPRFWTHRDRKSVCGNVGNTAQTISFFTQSDAGDLHEVMRTRLDLRGLEGRRINFVWTVPDP